MKTGQVNGLHDKMARTKTNTQNSTKHAEQQDLVRVSQTEVCCGFVLIGRRGTCLVDDLCSGLVSGRGRGPPGRGKLALREPVPATRTQRGEGRYEGCTDMFVEYKYQNAIDIFSIFTISTYTNCRWQNKVHIKIHNNKNAVEHQNIQWNEHCNYKHESACIVVRSWSLFMNRFIKEYMFSHIT